MRCHGDAVGAYPDADLALVDSHRVTVDGQQADNAVAVACDECAFAVGREHDARRTRVSFAQAQAGNFADLLASNFEHGNRAVTSVRDQRECACGVDGDACRLRTGDDRAEHFGGR